MEKNEVKKHWYDSIALVIILIIFIFPVGLYGLYKSSKIKPAVKWIVFVAWFLLIIIAGNLQNQKKQPNTIEPNAKSQTATTPLPAGETNEELSAQYKKLNIVVDPDIAPKNDPLKVRELIAKHINNDFDRDFLLSVDLLMFAAVGMDYTIAQFKKDYTYTDERTGKSKKGKTVFRSFNVRNNGTVEEGYGERAIYKELNSLEQKKWNAYSLSLRDQMYKDNRFNKEEWERLSNADFAKRLEKQKQEYIEMVKKYDLK